jgi:hypothetical protein
VDHDTEQLREKFMPVTTIANKATNQLKVGSGYIRSIMVISPGTTWTLQLADGPVGNTNTAPIVYGATALAIPATIGNNLLTQPIFFSNGIQVITAGTTAGEMDVDWI